MEVVGRKSTGGQANQSLSSIEQAVNKFLGGFTALKSEISQLKDTVLSNQTEESSFTNN